MSDNKEAEAGEVQSLAVHFHNSISSPALQEKRNSHTSSGSIARERDLKNALKEFELETRDGASPVQHRLLRSKSMGSEADMLGTGFGRLKLSSPRASQHTYSKNTAVVGASLVTATMKRDGKLMVCMCGLPARGKTFLAQSLQRHLDWVGIRCKIFNAAEYRREHYGVWQPHEFFSIDDEKGEEIRFREATLCLDDALNALKDQLDIVIYDAANVTMERRRWVMDKVQGCGLHTQVIFIECLCNDKALIEENVREIRLSSPEYINMEENEATEDFIQRMMHYEKQYEPIEAEEGWQFIKFIDAGKQILANLISGYIPGRVLLLMANLHITSHPIWMSRHGESEFNLQGRIGGNAGLTPAGHAYALKLTEFIRRRYPNRNDIVIWTSTLLRTGQTVSHLTNYYEVVKWRALDEINAGLMEGLTYDYVSENMPEEYNARKEDKLTYRYPRGESYIDVFARLEPVIFEMMKQRTPLLIIGHQAILRVLYGYLMRKAPVECPTLAMPLHTAIKLRPKAYTCEEEWHTPLESTDASSPVVNHGESYTAAPHHFR